MACSSYFLMSGLLLSSGLMNLAGLFAWRVPDGLGPGALLNGCRTVELGGRFNFADQYVEGRASIE
jgi:hypothetical protein